jgi:hypothetical protein
MRTPALLSRADFSGASGAFPNLAVPGETDEPAALLATVLTVARLSVVLAIALGFGLAAHVLIGVAP